MSKNLVWKLLRRHISLPQMSGFVLANLVGMTIILLGFQFYSDAFPVFSGSQGLLSSDVMVLSKKVGMAQTVVTAGGSRAERLLAFTPREADDLRGQPFVRQLGAFTTPGYSVSAALSIEGNRVLNVDLPFESVPDGFVDVPPDLWTFNAELGVVPIILPRSYIAMYNFGFARSQKLPVISESTLAVLDIDMRLSGNGRSQAFKGKVIGFTGKMNSILVPEAFMQWANARFSADSTAGPLRLIVDTDSRKTSLATRYVEDHGYEVENDRLDNQKSLIFLQLVSAVVVGVGIVISLLSIYILLLSIYLLVEKNSEKLQNLLLIGYAPATVARPYQLLAAGLNLFTLLVAWGIVSIVRPNYLASLSVLLPVGAQTTLLPCVMLGLGIFLVLAVLNAVIIVHKIKSL